MSAQNLSAALANTNQNRVAYAGQVSQKETIEIITEDGDVIHKDVVFFITWDTIAKILSMVGQRAQC